MTLLKWFALAILALVILELVTFLYAVVGWAVAIIVVRVLLSDWKGARSQLTARLPFLDTLSPKAVAYVVGGIAGTLWLGAAVVTFGPQTKLDPDGQKPSPQSVQDQSVTTVASSVTAGIGARSSTIKSAYIKSDLRLTFEPWEPVYGQSRVVGSSPEGFPTVELIGPDDNLTEVSITVVPLDNTADLSKNIALMYNFLTVVEPEWKEGPNWLGSALGSIASQFRSGSRSESRTTAFKELSIKITASRLQEPLNTLFNLSIRHR